MKLLHIGPKIKGNRLLDEHCVFGNNMELTKEQLGYLEEIVGDCAGEPFKLYVYRMTKSSVIPVKAKDGKTILSKFLLHCLCFIVF